MGTGESNPEPLRLRLSAATAIHDAVNGAHLFAARYGIGGAVASRLAILVEELVTNLLEHAGLAGLDPIRLELVAHASEIHLTLIDQGSPFDLRRISEPRPIPERGGGAGLALVRAWVTHLDYRSDHTGNRLTLVLPLDG